LSKDGRRDLGEVDGLKAISVGLKWRIPLGKKRPKDLDVILRPYLVSKLGEIDFHLPADVFPILSCVPELQWLWAFPAIGLIPIARILVSMKEKIRSPGATSRIDS
jgi:hypothetical protein